MTKPSHDLKSIAVTNSACLGCSEPVDYRKHTCVHTPLCTCHDPGGGPEECTRHKKPKSMALAKSTKRETKGKSTSTTPAKPPSRDNGSQSQPSATCTTTGWKDDTPSRDNGSQSQPSAPCTTTGWKNDTETDLNRPKCFLCNGAHGVKDCPLRPAVEYLRDHQMFLNIILSTLKRVHHHTCESYFEGLLHHNKHWTVTGVNRDLLNNPDTRTAVPDLPDKPTWLNNESIMLAQLENVLYGEYPDEVSSFDGPNNGVSADQSTHFFTDQCGPTTLPVFGPVNRPNNYADEFFDLPPLEEDTNELNSIRSIVRTEVDKALSELTHCSLSRSPTTYGDVHSCQEWVDCVEHELRSLIKERQDPTRIAGPLQPSRQMGTPFKRGPKKIVVGGARNIETSDTYSNVTTAEAPPVTSVITTTNGPQADAPGSRVFLRSKKITFKCKRNPKFVTVDKTPSVSTQFNRRD
jgi:hypothetical protein